jgi:hypothetical protein
MLELQGRDVFATSPLGFAEYPRGETRQAASLQGMHYSMRQRSGFVELSREYIDAGLQQIADG